MRRRLWSVSSRAGTWYWAREWRWCVYAHSCLHWREGWWWIVLWWVALWLLLVAIAWVLWLLPVWIHILIPCRRVTVKVMSVRIPCYWRLRCCCGFWVWMPVGVGGV